MHEKGERGAWEKEKELDILRFLTIIELYVDRWGKRQNDDRAWQSGQREEERGKGECVKGCTATKDHEKFLEIGLYEGEREGTSKEGDRSNEVDSLFSVFSTDGGIVRLSDQGAFFSRFARFYAEPRSSLALFPRLLFFSLLSLSLFFSRHNEAFMSWTSALVPLFLLDSESALRKTLSNVGWSFHARLETFDRFFSDAKYIHMEVFFFVELIYPIYTLFSK